MNKPIINGITSDDTLVLECTIPEDITGWKIRCELYDEAANTLRLATTNSGGSTDQIEIIQEQPAESTFLIKIPSGETSRFLGSSVNILRNPEELIRVAIEIEVDTGNIIAGKPEIITIFDGYIDLKQQKITWEDPAD